MIKSPYAKRGEFGRHLLGALALVVVAANVCLAASPFSFLYGNGSKFTEPDESYHLQEAGWTPPYRSASHGSYVEPGESDLWRQPTLLEPFANHPLPEEVYEQYGNQSWPERTESLWAGKKYSGLIYQLYRPESSTNKSSSAGQDEPPQESEDFGGRLSWITQPMTKTDDERQPQEVSEHPITKASHTSGFGNAQGTVRTAQFDNLLAPLKGRHPGQGNPYRSRASSSFNEASNKSPRTGEASTFQTARSSLTRQLGLSGPLDEPKTQTGPSPKAAKPKPNPKTARPEEESKSGSGWTGLTSILPPMSTMTYPEVSATGKSGTQLVTYLQESLPPISVNIDGETEEIPAPTDEQEGAKNKEDEETLGREPEDNSLQFLRTSTVLLEPGQMQCDVGLTYTISDNDFPILLTDGSSVTAAEVDFRIRELQVPLEIRYGLAKRVQAFLGLPVGWSNTELTFVGNEAFENDGGIGDLIGGFTIQLREATVDCPDVIATVAFSAPTGSTPFLGNVGLAPSSPSLGTGFWSIAGSVLWIRSYDPIVVFYGLGTRHYFERQFLGREVRLGGEYNYNLGVGFAVNERITLSTRFRGAYIEETKLDGVRVPGSILEPMSIRMAATISQKKRILEPFVEFGTTRDAISSNLGVICTY